MIPSPRTSPEERWQIVTRAQQGESGAFARLYELYQPTVFRFVYARTHNRAVAEDLTQDVFLRALRAINTVQWQGRDPGAWLNTIARNITVDHFKSKRRHMEITVGEVLDGGDRIDHTPEGDPAELVAAWLDSRPLRDAAARLLPSQYEVLRLRFLCGLTVEQTAAVMGRNRPAVRQLQHRAVRALRALLDEAEVTSC